MPASVVRPEVRVAEPGQPVQCDVRPALDPVVHADQMRAPDRAGRRRGGLPPAAPRPPGRRVSAGLGQADSRGQADDPGTEDEYVCVVVRHGPTLASYLCDVWQPDPQGMLRHDC